MNTIAYGKNEIPDYSYIQYIFYVTIKPKKNELVKKLCHKKGDEISQGKPINFY